MWLVLRVSPMPTAKIRVSTPVQPKPRVLQACGLFLEGLAHLPLQHHGQFGVRIGDRLVLASEAAQFLGDVLYAPVEMVRFSRIRVHGSR